MQNIDNQVLLMYIYILFLNFANQPRGEALSIHNFNPLDMS